MSALSDLIEETRGEFKDDPVVSSIVTRLLLSGATAGVLLVMDKLPVSASRDAVEAIASARRVLQKMATGVRP